MKIWERKNLITWIIKQMRNRKKSNVKK
jgi:hypothetical protein